jgi:hypothetical protein
VRQSDSIPADRHYGSAANVLGGGNGRMWITWMTCGSDGYEHAVADEAIIASNRHRSGVYGAMCGHAVIAQALVAPPGRRCPRCMDSLPGRRVPRKEVWWKSWLHKVFLKGKDINSTPTAQPTA